MSDIEQIDLSTVPHLTSGRVRITPEFDVIGVEGKGEQTRPLSPQGVRGVWSICLTSPTTSNALNTEAFEDLLTAVRWLGAPSTDCRCILLISEGKTFCSGIDLNCFASIRQFEGDAARKALHIQSFIEKLQDVMLSFDKCHVPVLCLIHGPCIGGGVDLITACDVRMCSKETWFKVEEVNVGLAADLGTLQRLPRLVSSGWAREVSLTGRVFDGEEAKQYGLVNYVFDSRERLYEEGFAMANIIANKSPVAVRGTKMALASSLDTSVEKGLATQRIWNSAMLQTDDIDKIAVHKLSLVENKRRDRTSSNVKKSEEVSKRGVTTLIRFAKI